MLSLLEQVMTADRTSIARALVKLCLNQGMIVKLLHALTKVEVTNTGTKWMEWLIFFSSRFLCEDTKGNEMEVDFFAVNLAVVYQSLVIH